MPTASSSTVKPGDRFKEGVAVKVFKDAAQVRAARSPSGGKYFAHDDGPHVLLGRPATFEEPLTEGHQEYDFEGQRVIMHDDSAPHPVSWLHPA